MSNIVSSDGMALGGPKVDLSMATDTVCSACGNFTFVPVVLLKHISALASPNGQEGHLPLQTYACGACNNVNPEFLPKGYLETFKQKQAASGKPNLTVVK